MSSAAGQRRIGLVAPFERIAGALADPKRGSATALLLIVAYAVVWWLYAIVAKSSQDIHFDMGEVANWGLVPAFGYPKHPPLPGWVAAVWFAIFPRADWSFYLLSATSIGVALWFVWLIAARFVAGDKRVLALVLLTFSPGFNFQPLKFNSNALLIPMWAAASYAFIRSFQDRTVLWGVAAGVAAALAMLTKYWSAFLILGFVVAVLANRRCWGYLRSPAPWAAVVAGALLLAPNFATLFQYDFQPFKYAASSHSMTFDPLMQALANYAGGLLYLAGGLLAVVIACRPDPGAVRDMLLPADRDLRMMAVALWTAFLAPVLVSLLTRMRVDTAWTMPMWAVLPAVLLASPRVAVTRSAAASVLAAAMVVPLAALLLSPAVAYVIHRQGVPNHASHYRLIAAEVDKAWREATARPLRFLGGDNNIALGASYYLTSHPLVQFTGQQHLSPWASPERVAQDGLALVCHASDAHCLLDMARQLSASRPFKRTDVELSRTFLGFTGPVERYVIVVAPPRP
jgi:4-amino-4-deoxy-L-arabinose transferase-like glycosyltransferase